jgi:hypothetical protein
MAAQPPIDNPSDERLADATRLLGLAPQNPGIAICDLDPANPQAGYVSVYLEPIKTYTISKRSKQTQLRVGPGRIVYAPRQGPEDRERLEDFYLEGERIVLESYGEDDTCQVFDLALEAGRFGAKIRRPLAGISITQEDVASISLEFKLRIENPQKYIERCPEPTSEQSLKILRSDVARFIAGDVKATFQEDIQLWSKPKVGQVADVIFARLDDKLKEWGLRLRKAVTAERKYPARLNDLVMDFRATEQEFFDLEPHLREALREEWGFQVAAIAEMQHVSEKMGRGAGLLWIARKHKANIEPFLEWLTVKRNPATVARDFLKEIYVDQRYPRDATELSEQLVFSAIRHPVLGLGEWADTELEQPEKSEYLILEGFLQTVPPPEAAPEVASNQPK